MTFQKHLGDTLPAFVDGQLPAAEASRATGHVEACEHCRAAIADFQFAARMLRGLAIVEAPPSIWTSIEERLALEGSLPGEQRASEAGARRLRSLWEPRALALAAAVVLALTAVVLWQTSGPAPHDIVRLDLPSGAVRLAAGEWLETDAASPARIRIGEIGTVDIAPNTRVQVVAARANEHRLNLAHGSISAEIAAPPRLFFVETPSSTVVDLGCAYTMDVDETGVGQLRVTSGWASLEWDTLESLVPAGASCPTRPQRGPGTPAFDDASPRLRAALLAFDYGGGGSAAVDVVLAEARQRDTLTLWHLLSRVEPSERPRIFARMAALTPLPPGVARERALALDPETLRLWREELAWTW